MPVKPSHPMSIFEPSITRRQLLLLAGAAGGSSIVPAFSGTLKPLAGKSNPAEFFYRPEGAWAADFIPLYANGKFQLFFLLDWRDVAGHGEGTPWYRVSTVDFVNFKEHGEVLSRGSTRDQDLYVFTGSVIQAKDGFHIFYTGHNPHLRDQGKPEQAVMHAVSQDLNRWTKRAQDTFFAPTDKYEKDNWRDPFVFWNEEEKQYNMLLAARVKQGIPRRRGVTLLCTSTDLATWHVQEPFYAPNLYYAHECPDLFRMGDWWYFIFSEFSDKARTRYRMSRSLQGPWLTPRRDDFDGHAFYAAKSASDGKNRFLFGWNPTRNGSKDDGEWEWGGNLVVHELIQENDGELGVKVPQSIAASFGKAAVPVSFESGVGAFQYDQGVLRLDARDTFAAAVAGPQPRVCRIHAKAQFQQGTEEFGLMFRTSGDLNNSYYIKIEPQAGRLVFDLWPKKRWGQIPHIVELERSIDLSTSDTVALTVLIDGNMGVAYLNDTIAMSFRAYDLVEGNWGFFANDGRVSFSDIDIRVGAVDRG